MSCSRDVLNRLWGGHGLVNLLADPSLDKEIVWRHTSLVHFLKMLKDKKNVLPHVSKWKDPFEGIVFKAKYVDENDKPVKVEEVYSRFFGQCWTLKDADNELLWNARSPNGYGICLRTRVKKLKAALRGLTNVEDPPAVVIGKIQYKKMDAIRYLIQEMGRKHSKNDALGRLSDNGAISLFFLKRDSFKNENELRIVANIGDIGPSQNLTGVFNVVRDRFGAPNTVNYVVDPMDFIEEVILDPRMPPGVKEFVESVRDENGWSFNIIESKLYQYIDPQPTIRVYTSAGGNCV